VKLVLQIALGVFLGALASQLSVDAWRAHAHKEEKAAIEAAFRLRAENQNRIRALFMQGRQGQMPSATKNPPPGFIPEDVQAAEPSRNK